MARRPRRPLSWLDRRVCGSPKRHSAALLYSRPRMADDPPYSLGGAPTTNVAGEGASRAASSRWSLPGRWDLPSSARAPNGHGSLPVWLSHRFVHRRYVGCTSCHVPRQSAPANRGRSGARGGARASHPLRAKRASRIPRTRLLLERAASSISRPITASSYQSPRARRGSLAPLCDCWKPPPLCWLLAQATVTGPAGHRVSASSASSVRRGRRRREAG